MVTEIQLSVAEIYRSLQGETSRVGCPTVLVRLAGCPLRCVWCDTPGALLSEQGKPMSVEAILAAVAQAGAGDVLLTGGEPLVQEGAIALLGRLVDTGRRALLETSGALPIHAVPRGVKIIMDLKAPGSGMVEHNRLANLGLLGPEDEIKIVVADRADFDWAVALCRQHRLTERVGSVLLSPAAPDTSPRELAQWILDSRMNLRLQLQMHKIVWGSDAQGV